MRRGPGRDEERGRLMNRPRSCGAAFARGRYRLGRRWGRAGTSGFRLQRAERWFGGPRYAVETGPCRTRRRDISGLGRVRVKHCSLLGDPRGKLGEDVIRWLHERKESRKRVEMGQGCGERPKHGQPSFNINLIACKPYLLHRDRLNRLKTNSYCVSRATATLLTDIPEVWSSHRVPRRCCTVTGSTSPDRWIGRIASSGLPRGDPAGLPRRDSPLGQP